MKATPYRIRRAVSAYNYPGEIIIVDKEGDNQAYGFVYVTPAIASIKRRYWHYTSVHIRSLDHQVSWLEVLCGLGVTEKQVRERFNRFYYFFPNGWNDLHR